MSTPVVREAEIFRIAIVCSLTSLLVGSDACDIVTQPHLIHLLSTRALWEARNTWAWEKEYDTFQSQFIDREPSLDTIGDLAIVKHASMSDTVLVEGRKSSLDILDDWHAGLDGLGMLLAAVMADV